MWYRVDSQNWIFFIPILVLPHLADIIFIIIDRCSFANFVRCSHTVRQDAKIVNVCDCIPISTLTLLGIAFFFFSGKEIILPPPPPPSPMVPVRLWFDSTIMQNVRYIFPLFWYQHSHLITRVQSKNEPFIFYFCFFTVHTHPVTGLFARIEQDGIIAKYLR